MGVLVHKVYDALVVFGVLVILAVALHNFERSQVHLNGFNYLTANPCREYEGIGFLVVFTAEHADVLRLAFIVILIYAFKHLDNYFLVRDYQSEEFGFVGDEILCIFFPLQLPLLLTLTPFNLPAAALFGPFLLVYGFNLSACIVVCHNKIFGADVLRVAEVLTEPFEHTQIVAPHGEVVYPIFVTLGNQIGCPAFIGSTGIEKKVFHNLNLTAFHKGLNSWV